MGIMRTEAIGSLNCEFEEVKRIVKLTEKEKTELLVLKNAIETDNNANKVCELIEALENRLFKTYGDVVGVNWNEGEIYVR